MDQLVLVQSTDRSGQGVAHAAGTSTSNADNERADGGVAYLVTGPGTEIKALQMRSLPHQTTTVMFSRASMQFGKSSWQRFSTLARNASLWFGSWWVKTSLLTPASRAHSTACS
jgi:hypothetical protein